MKYSAFISYRHGGMDEFVAKNLQKMMESYRIPGALAKKLGCKKVGRIFRDTDELPTSGSLYDNIEEALKETEYLIVICTPRLKESKWCMRELELFIQLRGLDHVLAVLAEGEPADSFPDLIRYREENGQRVEVEPLAADVRSSSQHGMKVKMKVEMLRLLAAILGCDFDQLRQRARRRQMQQRMGVAGVAFGVVCLFLGMMTRENFKLQKEVSRTQEAQSYLLSQYSQKQYQGDDRVTASLLALEGLPEDLGDSRPFVSASLSALTNALQIYNYQQGYVADKTIPTRTLDAVAVSPDGKWIAYTDLRNSTTYTTHFYEIATGEIKAEFSADPDYCPYGSSKAKAVFLGDNQCALAGKDGVMVIDTNTMETLWTGNAATMVEVSKDESVIAACDYRTGTANFYQADGTLLSSTELDTECICVPFGLSEDGSQFVMAFRSDDAADTVNILDTKTGKIQKEITGKNGYNICMYRSSWTDGTFAFLYTDDEHDTCYGWYDQKSDQVNYTEYSVVNLVCEIDSRAGVFYANHGNQLEQVDMKTGEVLSAYSAGGSIAAAKYCGDSKWEIACTDGALEYIDFGETPYCITRTDGDGTGCTDLAMGGEYMVSYLLNAYKVNLYRLNDRTTENRSDLPRKGEETMVYITRGGNLLNLNTTINTYTVNMDNLQVQTYKSPVSFLQVGNENIILLDELDGTNTVYDAATAEKKCSMPSGLTVLDNMDVGFKMDEESHKLVAYSYDTGEAAEEYTVPENCVDAVYVKDHLICDCVDGDKETIEIYDENQKKLLEEEVTFVDFSKDYVRYTSADKGENVVYDLDQDKEIFRQDCGTVDWSMSTSDRKYIFLSSVDQGGYIIDHQSGEVVMTMGDSSTLYNVMSWENSPYLAMLYISDSGSTRLDVYLKDHPDSPVAEIAGGLGLNSKDEVIVNDGESYIYAVPVMSKEEVYQAGLKFTGKQTLTDRQRQEYHCQ